MGHALAAFIVVKIIIKHEIHVITLLSIAIKIFILFHCIEIIEKIFYLLSDDGIIERLSFLL